MEFEGHGGGGGEDNSVAVGESAVDHGHFHFAAYGQSGQRGPTAAAESPGIGQRVGFAVVVDDHEVGIVAGAYESAAVDAVDDRGVVAHGPDNVVKLENPFRHHLKHKSQ